jgi:hypothetical protein
MLQKPEANDCILDIATFSEVDCAASLLMPQTPTAGMRLSACGYSECRRWKKERKNGFHTPGLISLTRDPAVTTRQRQQVVLKSFSPTSEESMYTPPHPFTTQSLNDTKPFECPVRFAVR